VNMNETKYKRATAAIVHELRKIGAKTTLRPDERARIARQLSNAREEWAHCVEALYAKGEQP